MFKVMTGTYGIDGLESKHSVFAHDDPEACWKWLLQKQEDATDRFAREEYYTMWVEEQTDLNDDYSAVWIKEPYPQPHRPDVPQWYVTAVHKLHVERNAAA